MKFILWYSVPFVGKHSKAWNRFKGKFLDPEHGVLDDFPQSERKYYWKIIV